MQKNSKIAIIGTGISGLAASYMLHKDYQITVYEKESVIGGHTRTRNVIINHKEIPVDTGFIVFNNRNYPQLTRLFDILGVPSQPSIMTFAASINDGEMEWSARNINTIFGQRSHLINPKFYGMLLDIKRFFKAAPKTLEANSALTLGELLDDYNMGDWFRRYFLLPMGGAIWSCPLSTMLEFPAQSFVQFFKNHGLLTISDQPEWRTVTGGSRQYHAPLTAGFNHLIRTGCGVTSVKRLNNQALITDKNGETIAYDGVIFACHADEAYALLSDKSALESAVLGSFKYQKNKAILHSDISFMPKRRNCWASWVYMSNEHQGETDLSVTYWMNELQAISCDTPLLVTLNPNHAVAEDKIYDQHEFSHPIFTMDAIAAQARIPELQGQQNTWFCGAYQRYGFHEDGLMSAANLGKYFEVNVPWL